MREIPMKKRMKVLKLYFEGYPYDEIAFKTGVAKGSVVNIVRELRNGRYPEFASALDIVDELRDLAVRIRKNKASISQAIIGFRFFERLKFVEPSMLEGYIRMCEKLSQPGFPVERFTASAIRLCELEERLGKPYDEAVEDLEDELRKKSSLLEELKSEADELARKKGKAERDLKDLEERCRLKEGEIKRLIEGEKDLMGLGIERVSRLSSFAMECEELGYSVEKLIELLKLVEERESIEDEVESLRMEVDALKKEKERHSAEEFEMIRNNKRLITASAILKTRRVAISCALCRSSIYVSLPPEGMVDQGLRSGAIYPVRCSWCGFVNQIGIRDVLAAVGYTMLIS